MRNQSNPLENMAKFNNRSKPNTKEGKNKKQIPFDNALYEGRKSTLKAFESEIFPIEATKGEGLNLLSPKQMASLAKWLSVRLRTKWLWVQFQLQMLHILPIALTQIKAGNTQWNSTNYILFL